MQKEYGELPLKERRKVYLERWDEYIKSLGGLAWAPRMALESNREELDRIIKRLEGIAKANAASLK